MSVKCAMPFWCVMNECIAKLNDVFNILNCSSLRMSNEAIFSDRGTRVIFEKNI